MPHLLKVQVEAGGGSPDVNDQVNSGDVRVGRLDLRSSGLKGPGVTGWFKKQ